MDAISEARASADAEEETERIANLYALRDANEQLADARRNRESDAAAADRASDEAECQAVQDNPVLAETSAVVYTAPGARPRIRRDMFKGVARELVRETLSENGAAVRGHVEARRAAKAETDAEALEQQELIADAARQQHADEALEALAGRMELREFHAMQAGEHARNEAERKADAKGAVYKQYFDSFGASGR